MKLPPILIVDVVSSIVPVLVPRTARLSVTELVRLMAEELDHVPPKPSVPPFVAVMAPEFDQVVPLKFRFEIVQGDGPRVGPGAARVHGGSATRGDRLRIAPRPADVERRAGTQCEGSGVGPASR